MQHCFDDNMVDRKLYVIVIVTVMVMSAQGFKSRVNPCSYETDSSDSFLVRHLLTSWQPAWQPSHFDPHTCTRTSICWTRVQTAWKLPHSVRQYMLYRLSYAGSATSVALRSQENIQHLFLGALKEKSVTIQTNAFLLMLLNKSVTIKSTSWIVTDCRTSASQIDWNRQKELGMKT